MIFMFFAKNVCNPVLLVEGLRLEVSGMDS